MTSHDDNQNYTQNIDTLETAAGVNRVLQCHGSFANAFCIQCRRKVIGTEIEEDILAGRVPLCQVCNSEGGGVEKGSKVPKEKRNAKNKKRKKGGWDVDESEEDEPDTPDYPPGIMKVLPFRLTRSMTNKAAPAIHTAGHNFFRRETYR